MTVAGLAAPRAVRRSATTLPPAVPRLTLLQGGVNEGVPEDPGYDAETRLEFAEPQQGAANAGLYRPCRSAISFRHSSAVGMIGLSTRWRIFHCPSSRTNSSS